MDATGENERWPKLLEEAALFVRRLSGRSPRDDDLWGGTPYPAILASVKDFAMARNADRAELARLGAQAFQDAKDAHQDHRHRTAIVHLYQALAYHTVAGNLQDQASALGNLSVQFHELSDNELAIRLQEEALRLKRAAGSSPDQIARSLHIMGISHAYLGNLETARELQRQAIDVLPRGYDAAVQESERWIARLDRQIALTAQIAQILEGASPPKRSLAGMLVRQAPADRSTLDQARAVAKARLNGDIAAEARAQLDLADILWQEHRLFSQVSIQAGAAERLAFRLNDRPLRARALTLIARSAVETGQFTRAHDAAERALVIFRQLKDRHAALDAQLYLALICLVLGEEHEARQHVYTALDAAAGMPFSREVLETLQRFGNLYLSQDFLTYAASVVERALELAEANAVPPSVRVELYEQLAHAYFIADRLADAVRVLHDFIALAEETGDVTWLARAWIRVGSVYVRAEDFDGAITALEAATPYVDEARDPELDRLLHGLDLSMAGLEAHELGHELDLLTLESDLAKLVPGTLEFSKHLSTLFAEITRLDREKDRERLAGLHADFASLLDRAEEYQDAEVHFLLAIGLATKAGMMRQLGSIFHGYGVLLARSGRTEAAGDAFAKALSLKDQYADGDQRLSSLINLAKANLLLERRTDVASLLPDLTRQVAALEGAPRASFALLLSQIYNLIDRRDEALTWINEALHLRGAGNPDEYLAALVWATRLFARAGRIEEARRFGQEAADLAAHLEGDLVASLRGVHQRRSREVVEALLEAHATHGNDLDPETLLQLERFKSRELINRLSRIALAPPSSMPASLRDKELQLRKDLDLDEYCLHHRELRSHIDVDENGDLKSRAALRTFWDELPQQWRAYGQLRQGKAPDLESLLAGRVGETPVHFLYCHQSYDRLHVWHVDRAGRVVAGFAAPISRARCEEIVSATRDAFGRRQAAHVAWSELSTYLLGPVLPSIPEQETLCVVPSGLLAQAPLCALRVDGGYLVERHPIVFQPSLSSLAYWPEHPRAMALGPAVVLGDSEDNLRFARLEAEYVAKRLGTNPLVGDAVVRASFQSRLADCSIFHVACHAGFDPDQPDRSGFRLADGSVFSARDAENALIRAQLAMLSACETGRAEVNVTDDASGLAASFLYAGVAAVVATLWKVHDGVTAQFATDFYDKVLGERVDLATALQRAQLQLLKQARTSHPYFWAGFSMTGQWVVDQKERTTT